MTDLLRFIVIRAPQEIPTTDIDVVSPSAHFEREAGELDLWLVGTVQGLPRQLLTDARAIEIRDALPAGTGEEALRADYSQIGDTLIRVKLFQKPPSNYGSDQLLELRSRYDVILRALTIAQSDTVIRRRPAAIRQDLFAQLASADGNGDTGVGATGNGGSGVGVGSPPVGGAQAGRIRRWIRYQLRGGSQSNSDVGLAAIPAGEHRDAPQNLRDLESALAALATVNPDGVNLPPEAVRGDDVLPPVIDDLTLTDAVLDSLPNSVDPDIDMVRGSDGKVPLGALFDRLLERHQLSETPELHQLATLIGNTVRPLLELPLEERQPDDDDVPVAMPVRPAPVGVADLLLVREHVKRYEGADVAHIENVLASEKRERKTRRLERTEELALIERETTSETERDNPDHRSVLAQSRDQRDSTTRYLYSGWRKCDRPLRPNCRGECQPRLPEPDVRRAHGARCDRVQPRRGRPFRPETERAGSGAALDVAY
jgi:hypothetical protein